MSRSKTFCRWLAFAVLPIFVLSAILSNEAVSDTEVELDKVKLQLKWHHHFQFAGYYAALEQGYYREAGLDVELIEGQPGINFVEEVTSGRANFGIELPSLLIERERGNPVVVLAPIFQHSPLILLTKSESGLTTPQDLVGRTIALHKDSDAELLAMLVNEGVFLDDVDISEQSWEIDDLISGKVDALHAYSTYEPQTLTTQDVPFTILRPITYGIDFYGDTLFTSQDEIDNHPRRVKAFREASLRGWAWALEHPEETIDLIMRDYETQYTREDMIYEASVIHELIRPELIKIGHVNPGRWKHIADTFVSLGMLDADYSLEVARFV
jgi:ABC-type nitrate/sulfonate/bicarbonate transport system substrate-binding protein